MRLRCPDCHQPIELVQDDVAVEVVCPSCGSSSSLVSGETAARIQVGGEAAIQIQGGQRCIGQFELLQRVGIGKFGAVWKARDTQLDRVVAVKIPRRDQLEPAEAELFLREARAAAQLKHPNIVGVHEVGRDRDVIYIVSDFIEGANLHDWLAAERVTPREAGRALRPRSPTLWTMPIPPAWSIAT